MRRIDVRTPAAWRSYDMWSGIIALLFPLALAGLWFAGVTPPVASCCGPAKVATTAPVVAAASPKVAAPAAALLPPEVDLISADGKVTVKGRVADEKTRDTLLADARRSFGDANVIDKLEVSADRGPLTWLASAKQVLSDFRDMPAPATIKAGASVITLTGDVETEADKNLRGDLARKHFGSNVTISNGINVRPRPVVIAKPKIDCGTITKGAQIAFATGSSELTDDGKAALDEIAPCITDGKWEIGGHTDNVGSSEVNQPLSWRRAAAAVEYLRKSKGEAIPFKAVGYGAIEPVADNDTDEGRAKNRRLTFKKIKY